MTTTPLDLHREANTGAGALDAIRERIEAAGVEYVYYQGVTISGRVIGKVVPARHLARNAASGVQLHRTAAADLQTTREGRLLGGGTAKFARLPLTPGEAIAAFGEDMVVRSALGGELSDLLVAYKTDEWARFCGHVTDWEFQMYAEALP